MTAVEPTLVAWSTGILAVGTVATAMAYSLGVHIGEHRQRQQATGRETLDREQDHVTVVQEDPESGYGTAIRETDGGVDVMAFNDENEIYQSTWIPYAELAAVCDELSSIACRMERDPR